MTQFFLSDSELRNTNDLVLLQSNEWVKLQLDFGSIQTRLSAPIAK